MKKRILALVLALCMAFSLVPMAAMAQGETAFTDVTESDFFYAPRAVGCGERRHQRHDR